MVDGIAYTAQHAACPFGATASVHGWERVGAALEFLCRRLLRIPALRYVDDFFAAERSETMEHAMKCMQRLIRAILGDDAVSDDPSKVACGKGLCILGVDITARSDGILARPTPQKDCLDVLKGS